jgi:hypothetical protein
LWHGTSRSSAARGAKGHLRALWHGTSRSSAARGAKGAPAGVVSRHAAAPSPVRADPATRQLFVSHGDEQRSPRGLVNAPRRCRSTRPQVAKRSWGVGVTRTTPELSAIAVFARQRVRVFGFASKPQRCRWVRSSRSRSEPHILFSPPAGESTGSDAGRFLGRADDVADCNARRGVGVCNDPRGPEKVPRRAVP